MLAAIDSFLPVGRRDMNPNELLYLLICSAVAFVVFYIDARRQSKTLLNLTDELSAEVRSTYLLDDYDRLESFCPEDFLTRDRMSKFRNNLWSSFHISFQLALMWFCVRSMIVQNGVLIGGWPLHQIVWASLLMTALVSIVRSIFRPLKSYAQRLNLGVNPLVTSDIVHAIQLLAFLWPFGILWIQFVNPQNKIDVIFIVISAIEFSIVWLIGSTNRISITDEGIFSSQESHPWQNIAWYRWYDHHKGVLVGIEPSGFRSPFLMILPASAETRDELDEMLERYATDKRLEDIDTSSQLTSEFRSLSAVHA